MSIKVEWTSRGTSLRTQRGRIVARGLGLGGPGARKLFRALIGDLLNQTSASLAEYVREVYPSVTGVSPSNRIVGDSLFVGVVIKDPHFFYQEWDTVPHWPPFGKGTPLADWAIAHGLKPFYVARAMALEAPTNAVVGGHRMTVSGGGGHESEHNPGRKVATPGKYKLADAMDEELDLLLPQIVDAVDTVLNSIIGGSG